eukprot:3660585-Amphidinium_carterae.1
MSMRVTKPVEHVWTSRICQQHCSNFQLGSLAVTSFTLSTLDFVASGTLFRTVSTTPPSFSQDDTLASNRENMALSKQLQLQLLGHKSIPCLSLLGVMAAVLHSHCNGAAMPCSSMLVQGHD